jgi:hypothetical protein
MQTRIRNTDKTKVRKENTKIQHQEELEIETGHLYITSLGNCWVFDKKKVCFANVNRK